MAQDHSHNGFLFAAEGGFLSPPGGFTLTGPVPAGSCEGLPVRGDLAHIRLAGQVFVPHYVAPVERRVGSAGAALLQAPGGAVLAQLAAGSPFHMLDTSGGYAWGEAGTLVGYMALGEMEA
ncbi:MAG TPA: SH3 domain-containing protein [Novosphingobium sp.]|nr:SH3 domain-containing protein [Novosphingobium sp.]HZV09584.1 SH3 domain-containing protein [Novosphingobium sp.]